MTCISISSESLSFSCYFISANFRDLELVHSLHSLHPNKFIPGPLLHSLHPKKHSGPAAAQSAPKSLHSLHPKKTFRARCCTVCTQKNSFPARCCTVCTQKKPFPARCCTVCTQSLHSLHPKKTFPGPLLHSLHPKSAQSAPRSENEISRQRERFR